MKQQVIARIISRIWEQGETEPEVMEIVTLGTCYEKNGRLYLFYEETLDGSDEMTANQLCVGQGEMYLRKRGQVSTELRFRLEEETTARYQTPYGPWLMRLYTQELSWENRGESHRIEAVYNLLHETGQLSQCQISIEIKEAVGEA